MNQFQKPLLLSCEISFLNHSIILRMYRNFIWNIPQNNISMLFRFKANFGDTWDVGKPWCSHWLDFFKPFLVNLNIEFACQERRSSISSVKMHIYKFVIITSRKIIHATLFHVWVFSVQKTPIKKNHAPHSCSNCSQKVSFSKNFLALEGLIFWSLFTGNLKIEKKTEKKANETSTIVESILIVKYKYRILLIIKYELKL